MDINNNIINTSINDVSTLSSSVNLSSVNNAERLAEDKSGSFSVDNGTKLQRSDLSNSLKEFISQLSITQSVQIQLESQSTLLSNIQSSISTILKSETPDIEADISQPSIQEHMEKYNSISSDISKNMEKFQEETDSTTYFDGRLGAKPLSISDIRDAVEKQMEIVNQHKEFTSKEISNIEIKVLDTIGKEVSKAASEAPFDPIDFGKNIGNFSSSNINSVVGSVAFSQANAVPGHSPKLLA